VWRKSYDFVSKATSALSVAYVDESEQQTVAVTSDVMVDEQPPIVAFNAEQVEVEENADLDDVVDEEEEEEAIEAEIAAQPAVSPTPSPTIWIGNAPPEPPQAVPVTQQHVWIGGEPAGNEWLI
jgi:hypothetical protein